MHRTQILLEEGQYLSLREAARRSGQSMGELIRQFVDQGLKGKAAKAKKKRYRLNDLKGILNDPKLAAEHHDDILYGNDP